MNLQEQIAIIQRNQAEVRAFVAEQHKLTRETYPSGWQLVITGMTAGTALFGAGAAFMKWLGA